MPDRLEGIRARSWVPSASLIATMLSDFAFYAGDLTDDEFQGIAAMLLTLGTRSEWRDAFAYADPDGEDGAEDNYAMWQHGRFMTAPELAEVIAAFSRSDIHEISGEEFDALASALLEIADAEDWQDAFQNAGPWSP